MAMPGARSRGSSMSRTLPSSIPSFADPDNAHVPDYRPAHRTRVRGRILEHGGQLSQGIDKAPPGFRWLRHFAAMHRLPPRWRFIFRGRTGW
jgi:hypothetical protein